MFLDFHPYGAWNQAFLKIFQQVQNAQFVEMGQGASVEYE
jgi:hypothetical protein